MNTNITRKIFILIIIAIIASALSACSGQATKDVVKLVVAANSDGSVKASHSTVQYNPRNTCGLSSGTLVLNAIEADLKAASEAAGKTITELDLTTDQWLDNHMAQFTCINAKEEK